jgi:hypothetical protein
MLLNKSKVLIPCEISSQDKLTWFLFLFISHSKILGCDRLPPLKEISSRDLERLERKMGLGYWVATTLKSNSWFDIE